MVQFPFHLRYQLTRRQRLLPHLKIWAPALPIMAFTAAGLLVVLLRWWWLAPLGLAWLWLFRNFFVGLADVLLRPTAPMDLIVVENGLGFLAGGERWWLFLDGVLSVGQLTAGVWTLQHFNGSVIHISADVITIEQVDYLKAAAARGREPEQIRAVIERGRLIERLQEEERKGKEA
jgi:hypothetical protein